MKRPRKRKPASRKFQAGANIIHTAASTIDPGRVPKPSCSSAACAGVSRNPLGLGSVQYSSHFFSGKSPFSQFWASWAELAMERSVNRPADHGTPCVPYSITRKVYIFPIDAELAETKAPGGRKP